MAFALLNYELAREVKTLEIPVILYTGEWEKPTFFYCAVPEDTIVHDLKALLCKHNDLAGFSPDNLRLYVHQPWYRAYQELDDKDEVLEWHTNYEHFHLDTGG